MTTTQYIEEKVKLFDKNWGNYASFTWNGDNVTGQKIANQTRLKIRKFLRNTLTQALAERDREIMEMTEEMKKIESLPPDLAGNIHSLPVNRGYNQALTNIKAFLTPN